MSITEHVPLRTLTTLKVGGIARYVIACKTPDDIKEAVAFAREHQLPFAPLGSGSNVLASDAGFPGVVLLVQIGGTSFQEDTADSVLVTVGAGVSWDEFVAEAASRGLWGIENLAGIPGTVGAAPVQNIGAYGAEVAQVIKEVEVYDALTNQVTQIAAGSCQFGYRDSRFKHESNLIILSVTFSLSRGSAPRVGYADLAAAVARGEDLSTPAAIGNVVRRIRGGKFPDLATCGTAGSFFKNPIISHEQHAALAQVLGAVPSFPVAGGVKVPLAFILDRMLGLRGHRTGHVSLFGNQPLVIVVDRGATAHEVDMFAHDIAERVKNATNISIEREVRNFPTQ